MWQCELNLVSSNIRAVDHSMRIKLIVQAISLEDEFLNDYSMVDCVYSWIHLERRKEKSFNNLERINESFNQPECKMEKKSKEVYWICIGWKIYEFGFLRFSCGAFRD